MPANVISRSFTNEQILFFDRADAESWRLSLKVPDATIENPGVVKKVLLPPTVNYSVGDYVLSVIVDNGDGTQSIGSAPNIAAFNELKEQVNALQSTVNSLILGMKNAGQGE